MGTLKEFYKLTRFEHAILLALAVFIAEIIVLGRLPALGYLIIFSLLVPIFSEMGSFVLNDYFDIETDRLNGKEDRPLVKGAISPRLALYFSIFSFVLSTALAFFINALAFYIVVLFNLVAILYNWKLKDTPLLGNIYIALTMAVPFVFGNFVVSNTLSITAVILAGLGFVAGLAREIIKTVQDVKGDVKARGSKTLPVIIGKNTSVAVAVFLYILFIPLSLLPFLFGLGIKVVPIIFVAAADLIIIISCYNILTKKDYKFARNASLIAFLIGLIGILISAIM